MRPQSVPARSSRITLHLFCRQKVQEVWVQQFPSLGQRAYVAVPLQNSFLHLHWPGSISALSLFPVVPRNDLFIWRAAQCLNNFAISDGICVLANAWTVELSKMPLKILMILSLNGTFLMAPAVLNQVCCEQKGCLLKRTFSLQSLGAVQPDWLYALSKSLSRDYNTISSH